MIALIVALACLSLLSVFKAPAKPLWFAAIGATEWGHYLLIASLVAALAHWRLARRWDWPSWLACGAALLYATPFVRATHVARDLPAQLVHAFGPATPRSSENAPGRSRPLRWIGLFRSAFSPPVQISRLQYAQNSNEPLWMDLYRPTRQDAPLPGVIVVHGGSWQSGDRQQLSDLNRYLAARGYLVASIDYRLAPGATFPAQREDVFTAIRYLKDHARQIGMDPDRIVLLGRSAGGQIALSVAYAQKDPAIKGVIAFYAPNDLVWGYAVPTNPLIMNSRKVIETYLGGPPSRVPDIYDAASPLHVVNATTPPTLMIHGDRDELVSDQHEVRLSKRLAEAGRPYFYLRMPWATHGCDANFNGPCGQLSTYAVERFLAAVMR
jgi:acetyl esterase/lipase